MNLKYKELNLVAAGILNTIGQCLFLCHCKSGETFGFSWSYFRFASL